MVKDTLPRFLSNSVDFTFEAWAIISAGFFVLLGIFYFLISSKRKRLPPGPRGLPVFGYYPFIGKDPMKSINELGKKYGDIFGFYMGSQYVVVPNDWKTATEVFNKVLDRPPELFKDGPFNFGLIGVNGPIWVESRRMISKAMKDIGLLESRWEELAQEEANDLVGRMLKDSGKTLELRNLFNEVFLNNILTLVLGERLPTGCETNRSLIKAVDTILDLSKTMMLYNFSRTLAIIMHILGIDRANTMETELQDVKRIVSDLVDQKLNNPDIETDNSFIGQMNQEIKQREKRTEMGEQFKGDLIKGNVLSLIIGGSETSRTGLIWLLIAMVENPTVQQKVHEELDRVLGKDGIISWSRRNEVPYTYATILEILRWKTIAPHPPMRRTSVDMEIQGYFIPKGTFFVINMWALHNDPRYWKEPEKFMPERFLSEDGKTVNTTLDSYAPFSLGKRSCTGRLVALMEMLQYFSIIMQKFKISPKEGNKLKYDSILGLTYQARNIELCFIPRE